MARFHPPEGVERFARAPSIKFDCLWPIGHLFYHTDSDTYFRFYPCGNRWDPLFAISTSKGFFCKEGLMWPAGDMHPYKNSDKNALCKQFLESLVK